MKIKLLHNSPLWLASHAIRMSHDNHDKSDSGEITELCDDPSDRSYITYFKMGEKDKALIERVGNKLKHKSVLEQLVYWFDIDGISRACLQELARHRTARLTVKSTRYTLNELKKINLDTPEFSRPILTTYLVSNDRGVIDIYNVDALENVVDILQQGVPNDKAKYLLPEAFKTRLQWQIDGRNLQNFLTLRSAKDALWEIRELAQAIYKQIPEEHKYLYKEYMK